MGVGMMTHTAALAATLPAVARELALAVRSLPADREVAGLGDAAGPMAIALGVLTGAVAMTRRSMLLRVAPIVADGWRAGFAVVFMSTVCAATATVGWPTSRASSRL